MKGIQDDHKTYTDRNAGLPKILMKEEHQHTHVADENVEMEGIRTHTFQCLILRKFESRVLRE